MEKAMAPHSSTLAWKIQWVEEPGRLQSMGSRRVGHDWATKLNWTELGERERLLIARKVRNGPSPLYLELILNNEFCFLPWPGSPSARLSVSEVYWFVSLCFYTYTHTHSLSLSLSLIPFKGWKNMCIIQVWHFLSACDCCREFKYCVSTNPQNDSYLHIKNKGSAPQ